MDFNPLYPFAQWFLSLSSAAILGHINSLLWEVGVSVLCILGYLASLLLHS